MEFCGIFVFALQSNKTFGQMEKTWYYCMAKKKQKKTLFFSVNMLINDMIKALMSFLLSALLLTHLFNPECYCPFVAL